MVMILGFVIGGLLPAWGLQRFVKARRAKRVLARWVAEVNRRTSRGGMES